MNIRNRFSGKDKAKEEPTNEVKSESKDTKDKVKFRNTQAYHSIRLVALTLFFTFVLMNLALLVLQRSYLPPFSVIDGLNLSFKSKEEALQILNNSLYNQKLTILYEGEEREAGFRALGINQDSSQIIKDFTEVSSFSSLPVFNVLENIFTKKNIQYSLNENKLDKYYAEFVKPVETEPVNARLIITANGPEIQPPIPGEKLDAHTATELTKRAINYQDQNQVTIMPVPVPAKIQAETLADNLEKAQNLLSSPVTLKGDNDKHLTIESQTLSEMAVISEDESGLTYASIDINRLKDYLIRDPFYKEMYIEPGETILTIKQGKEVKRIEGKAGREIDVDATANRITESLGEEETEVDVVFKDVEPRIVFDAEYSHDEIGLQALVDDFAAESPGEFGIVVEQLSKGKIRAEYNPDKTYVPASTYKMFASWAALKQVEQGKLSLDQVAGYVQQAIVVSSNEAGGALLRMVGHKEVDKMLKQHGFKNTSVQPKYLGEFMVTTAEDESRLLNGIYKNTLLKKQYSDIIIGHMRNQIIRWGIPDGSPGSVTANKVGYIYEYHHDMGIIYGPKVNYSITILTTNSSYWQINDLAKRLDEFFDSF